MSTIVRLGPEYFPDPTKGKPVSNGSIYIGEADLDPEVVANQIQVTAVQENGSEIAISQPIETGSGGVPLYNGSPVTLTVDSDYSMKILDSYGAQVYYVANTSVQEESDLLFLSDYGCDIAAAVADIGSVIETTLFVDCDSIITSGTTVSVSENIFLAILNGGSFDGVAGGSTETLNINGPFSAGLYQIFGENLTVSGDPKVNEILPEWFGAEGDGVTDDTDAIFGAKALAGVGGKITFSPNKNYLQSETIFPLDQQIYEFNFATLKASDSMGLHASNIWIQDVNSVVIENVNIDGNRSARTGTNGGAGIWVGDADDVRLENVTITDPNNDGVTIGYDDIEDADSRSFNPIINNLKVLRAYRNGLSVVGVVNANFTNIDCSYTAGANPQAGIDVEADSALTASENVRFTNIKVNNNAAFGFGTLTADDRDVTIINIEASDNGTFGVLASNSTTKCYNISGSGNVSGLTSVFGLDLSDIIADHRQIQAVRATLQGGSGADVITSASYVDGAFSASITTKWPSSAIVGVLTMDTQAFISSGTDIEATIRMVYGAATSIGYAKTNRISAGGNGANMLRSNQPISITFYDAVGARDTTRTYKVQGQIATGDSLVLANYELMLYEIAAF